MVELCYLRLYYLDIGTLSFRRLKQMAGLEMN